MRFPLDGRRSLAARARNTVAALLVTGVAGSVLVGCASGGATAGAGRSARDARPVPGELSCAQITKIPSFVALPNLKPTTTKTPLSVPLPSGTLLASCSGRWVTPPTDAVLVVAYRGVTADTYGRELLAAGWTNGGSTEPSGGGPGTWDSAKVTSYELDVSISGPYLLVVVDNLTGAAGNSGGS